VRPDGEADIAVEGPDNSLLYYHATPGAPWTGEQVAADNTTFSPPSIYVRDVAPEGEADIVAEGPDHSLYYEWARVGGSWNRDEVAAPGSTYSAPSIFVRSVDPASEADIAAEGPDNSLLYYHATPGAPWTGHQVLRVLRGPPYCHATWRLSTLAELLQHVAPAASCDDCDI
jgi:hypothetical protein